jgi:hypothetical protein
MEKTLVILMGNPRGGEETWETIYKHLLSPYNADLALCFGETNDKTPSLYKRAKYIWELPEYDNWRDYYSNSFEGNWDYIFKLNKHSGFMGGIDNAIGSGAIILAFRDYILKNKKDVLLEYDRIILSRSDYYYVKDHPILPLGKLYVPEAESYFGVTDRHHIFDSKFSDKVLGGGNYICDENNFKFLEKQDSLNIERALLLCYQHNGINHLIEECERVQFAVSIDSDKTRWQKPVNSVQSNDKIKYKYADEYKIAIENKIKNRYMKNNPKKIEITYFSDDKKKIHFLNKKYSEQRVEISVYEGFENNLIDFFSLDLQPQLNYWIFVEKGFDDKKIVFRDRETKEIILQKDYRKKIVLIQLWLGKIPDYFWFHYETTKNLKNVDFLFVTDQDISLDSPNYRVIKTDLNNIVDKISNLVGSKIELKNNKKTCDLKASLGDIFSEYIMDYEYFGCYDIDTLFGDVVKYVYPLLGKHDIISVAEKTYHDRLSGPFLIIKNTEELRTFYKTNEFIECFQSPDVKCYEEDVMDRLAKNKFDVKLIYSMNTNSFGKNLYDCVWRGGKNFINEDEIFLYHFYKKEHTKFDKVGNQIYAKYDKKFIDDFYWVFGFTENYSSTVKYLMESIHNYSNRKCVIYTINFDYQIPSKFLTSEQFILRRIDIEKGNKDDKGRDENIISSKPKLMIDVINQYPDKKFIFIDSDIYLTVSADDISTYFNQLENYPLINSHIHDRLYLSGIREGEKWTDTVGILADKAGVNVCVYPRRKTNVMLFDANSKWFFEEQIQMYQEYKGTEVGIFTLHDEDSANVVLSKHNLQKALHLCDIEETNNIEMDKFTDVNHPFHMTGISNYVKLPNHQNDIAVFHGLKTKERFIGIQKDYGNTVLDSEEVLVYYQNDTIFFEKNSFLGSKRINENVDFVIKQINGEIVESLSNQNLFQYFLFYISNIHLTDKTYIIEIVGTNSKTKLYNNVLQIK